MSQTPPEDDDAASFDPTQPYPGPQATPPANPFPATQAAPPPEAFPRTQIAPQPTEAFPKTQVAHQPTEVYPKTQVAYPPTEVFPQTQFAPPATQAFPKTQLDPAARPFPATQIDGANRPFPPTEVGSPTLPMPAQRSLPPIEQSGNALPNGTFLNEFELISVAGEGGFGIVYRAWDHSLKRQVAIKEYLPKSLAWRSGLVQVSVRSESMAEPFRAGLNSFVKEAQMLAQFDHPALVKVFRFWEANGSAYMVMPFYEGKTLRDELRSRSEPPDERTLLGWIGPVADALSVIHAEHWYHRDIAPDNIMLLAGSGRPLLLDFGAARRVIGDMTHALTVILKPGYAPVEQYAEIPGMQQGPWTDVYALAGVAYFALRGRTPPPSVSRLVNDSYEPLLDSFEGRYSRSFLSAVDHALVVRPEGRTKSVGEFKAAIGLDPPPPALTQAHYAASTPGRATPPPTIAPKAGAEAAPVDDYTLMPATPVDETPAPAKPQPADAKSGGMGRWVAVGVAAVLVIGGASVAWMRRGGDAPAVAAVPTTAGGAQPAAAPGGTAAVPSTGAPAGTTNPTVANPPVGTAPVATTPVAAQPVAHTPAATTYDVASEFDRVVTGQTPGWGLEVSVDQPRLRIGKDKLVFNLRSLQGGYVYVFNHTADGQLLQLYPNSLTVPPRVPKGGTLKLPQGRLEFNVEPPAGTSRLLVVVSRWPRDTKAMAPKEDGGFLTYPTGPAAAALESANTGKLPLIAGRAICPKGEACTDEFGAAAMSFDVVR